MIYYRSHIKSLINTKNFLNHMITALDKLLLASKLPPRFMFQPHTSQKLFHHTFLLLCFPFPQPLSFPVSIYFEQSVGNNCSRPAACVNLGLVIVLILCKITTQVIKSWWRQAYSLRGGTPVVEAWNHKLSGVFMKLLKLLWVIRTVLLKPIQLWAIIIANSSTSSAWVNYKKTTLNQNQKFPVYDKGRKVETTGFL